MNRHLFDKLVDTNMVEMVAFVDPARISKGVGNAERRSTYLAERFQQGKCDRVFLVPYNAG